MSRAYEEITYEVSDQIATITLAVPDRRNTFTMLMCRELLDVCDRIDADDEVRVVILTGSGRAFCAGADLSSGTSTFDYASQHGPDAKHPGDHETFGGVPRDAGGVASMRLAGLRKPLVVAFNGAAVGVGATMTLSADIRVAGESARFGFVFARRGIVPEAASSWFLPRIVGISQAMEWVATGRVFDAAEALAGGLVSRVVADQDLLATARSIAAEITVNTSAVSVALARSMMWSMLGAASPWDAHALDSQVMHAVGAGPDAAEGVASFLEKRAAVFPGKVSTDVTDLVEPWPGVTRLQELLDD